MIVSEEGISTAFSQYCFHSSRPSEERSPTTVPNVEYLGYPPMKASGNTTSWELSRVLARVVRVFSLVRVSERVGPVLVWITEMVRVRGIIGCVWDCDVGCTVCV